jgi:hypothetical protein
MRLRLLLLGLISFGFAAPASAALIAITAVSAVDTPDYDLTNVYGIDDWAYWSQTASSLTSPLAPSNEKLNASLIGSITPFGGGGIRGTTATSVPDYDFLFSNGTSTVSGLVNNVPGVFNTQLGTNGLNAGVQLSVIAPSADPFNVYVWATVFSGTSVLTADIGSATATSPTYITSGTRAPGSLFTILVTPDNAGQVLNIRYGLTAQTDVNANASLSAVAVGPVPIPEPSTLVLLVGGGLLGFGAWRRRRQA